MSAKQTYLAFFDELNVLAKEITEAYAKGEVTMKEIEEFAENQMMYGYSLGWHIGMEDLDTEMDEYEDLLLSSYDKALDSVYKSIDGVTGIDRLKDHLRNGDSVAEVRNLLETEFHRNVCEGTEGMGNTYEQREKSRVSKTWQTMLDNKVRDTHSYIEGMTVGLNDRFYTFDGDSARFPGDFANAQNNCGCRCVIKLNKQVNKPE